MIARQALLSRRCRKRNALIPEAEKIASAKVVIVRDDGESNAAWTRAFSIAMGH